MQKTATRHMNRVFILIFFASNVFPSRKPLR
jgi:hypothetical protein